MNYKYQPGDLVKLKLPKLVYQEDLCEVVSYNPAHSNPDKILTLKLQHDDIIIFTVNSGDGPNGIKEDFKIKMKPIHCSPSDVTPVDPNQPVETAEVVLCEKNSPKYKVAKAIGDYVRTPLYPNQTEVSFVYNHRLLKGVIIASQIDSKGIYYQVRVNGHRELKLVLEANLKPVGEKLKELL